MPRKLNLLLWNFETKCKRRRRIKSQTKRNKKVVNESFRIKAMMHRCWNSRGRVQGVRQFLGKLRMRGHWGWKIFNRWGSLKLSFITFLSRNFLFIRGTWGVPYLPPVCIHEWKVNTLSMFEINCFFSTSNANAK